MSAIHLSLSKIGRSAVGHVRPAGARLRSTVRGGFQTVMGCLDAAPTAIQTFQCADTKEDGEGQNPSHQTPNYRPDSLTVSGCVPQKHHCKRNPERAQREEKAAVSRSHLSVNAPDRLRPQWVGSGTAVLAVREPERGPSAFGRSRTSVIAAKPSALRPQRLESFSTVRRSLNKWEVIRPALPILASLAIRSHLISRRQVS